MFNSIWRFSTKHFCNGAWTELNTVIAYCVWQKLHQITQPIEEILLDLEPVFAHVERLAGIDASQLLHRVNSSPNGNY